MLGKGYGGLCNATRKEEQRKQKAKRRERDQIKFIGVGVALIFCAKADLSSFLHENEKAQKQIFD